MVEHGLPNRSGPRAAEAAPKDALELGRSGDHSTETFGDIFRGSKVGPTL